MPLCFVVDGSPAAATRTIATTSLAVQAECEPTGQVDRSFEAQTPYVTVGSDRTFVARALVAGYRSTFEGKFDRSGTSASGTLSVQFVEERAGVRYDCDSDTVAWSAKTPPPAVSAEPGTFCGVTEQSLELCFDVVGMPATVTDLTLLVRVQCTPAVDVQHLRVRSQRSTRSVAMAVSGFAGEASKTAGGGSSPFFFDGRHVQHLGHFRHGDALRTCHIRGARRNAL